MPTPDLARRARNHLAAALIALPLLIPFASARADMVAGARGSAWPGWECDLALIIAFTKIQYEYDLLLSRDYWQKCFF